MTTEHLRRAVEQHCGSRASFAYSAPVRHVFGETVWEGRVYVFDLIDHPSSSQAYAWESAPGSKHRLHAVCRSGGILGPAHAVRATLMGEGTEPRF